MRHFQTEKKRIFIASGGTGGHIIPARCLAKELAESGFEIFFFGDEKYRGYIEIDDSFTSKIISSSQLKKSPIFLVKAAAKIAIGVLQSLYFFLKIRPKYLVAFGGYATFPILISAIITRTKIILHEQNSHLGKVNRIFAKFADKIALSFVETLGIGNTFTKKTVFTGNPIRPEILALNQISYHLPNFKEEKSKDNKMGYDVILASDFYLAKTDEKRQFFNILIIGGSGGAKIFSEILPKAFFNLSESLKSKIYITQQCRQELVEETFRQYESFNINISVSSFFKNMPELIASAHLVIARAGSSSVFEFCAAKKPMILVPFAAAADNHQKKNAQFFVKNGAAILLEEKDFTINRLNEILRDLIGNEDVLQKMSDKASSLSIIDATKNLIKLVEND